MDTNFGPIQLSVVLQTAAQPIMHLTCLWQECERRKIATRNSGLQSLES